MARGPRPTACAAATRVDSVSAKAGERKKVKGKSDGEFEEPIFPALNFNFGV
jgi:hypothetical protein